MHRTLYGILAGGLLAGCSPALQGPVAPVAPAGTLTAQVTLGGYHTLETTWDIATLSCRVRQAGGEQSRELGRAQLELAKFSFQLAPGTASVETVAWSDAGSPIGRTDAVVGIRTGQVTLLRQTIVIGGENNSFRLPLTPLPIQ